MKVRLENHVFFYLHTMGAENKDNGVHLRKTQQTKGKKNNKKKGKMIKKKHIKQSFSLVCHLITLKKISFMPRIMFMFCLEVFIFIQVCF